MRRRHVVAAGTVSVLVPRWILAQQRRQPARIAWPASTLITQWPPYAAFVDAMRERGWVEGKH
jgi:hypothetical protein